MGDVGDERRQEGRVGGEGGQSAVIKEVRGKGAKSLQRVASV